MGKQAVAGKAEELRRWAAAHAGWLAVSDGDNLLENEVALICSLASIYDRKLTTEQAQQFLQQLPGSVLQADLNERIPFPPLRIPVSIGVTYAVGWVAEQWLADGCPAVTPIYGVVLQRQIFQARLLVDELREHPQKEIPLA